MGSFCFYVVAGPGVEPGSQGYEPYEVTVPLTRDDQFKTVKLVYQGRFLL